MHNIPYLSIWVRICNQTVVHLVSDYTRERSVSIRMSECVTERQERYWDKMGNSGMKM